MALLGPSRCPPVVPWLPILWSAAVQVRQLEIIAMLFKSQVFTQTSGSVGGLTFSHNAGGMYTRARATPTNPNTTFQQEVRNAMSTLLGIWSATLTPAQRDGWSDYAADTPVTNRLGDAITLSGISMFVKSNVPRLQALLAPVLNRPPFNDFGPSPELTPSAASAATQNVSIAFTNPGGWANQTGSALLIRLSRPQNPAINFFKGPYRLASVVLGNSTTPPASPVTVAFPFVAAEDSVIHLIGRITRVDGRLSPVFRQSIQVAA